MVTADSDLGPRELAQLIRAAFFCPSDDSDADSWERQRADFEQEALLVATRLLVSDDEARTTTIADAVARDLFWLIPHDRGVDIAVRNRKVAVTLGEPAASGQREVGPCRESSETTVYELKELSGFRQGTRPRLVPDGMPGLRLARVRLRGLRDRLRAPRRDAAHQPSGADGRWDPPEAP